MAHFFVAVTLLFGSLLYYHLHKCLRKRNKSAIIVYVTGYENYIFSAQENHCFQYLIKPVLEEKIYNVVEEALEYMNAKNTKITLLANQKRIDLELNDICYFELKDKKVSVKTIDSKYDLDLSKEEITKVFQKYNFALSHQNYLVNIENVSSVDKDRIKLLNNEYVPLAYRRAKEFKMKFFQWLFSRLENL